VQWEKSVLHGRVAHCGCGGAGAWLRRPNALYLVGAESHRVFRRAKHLSNRMIPCEDAPYGWRFKCQRKCAMSSYERWVNKDGSL
jgi:hypothetical protein